MSGKYSRILVPYDDSNYSKRALDEAVEASKTYGSKLYLMMVISEPLMEPPGMFFGMIRGVPMNKATEDYMDQAAYRADHILQEASEYCRKKKITPNYEIARGHVGEEILKFSKKKNIDLIIMGFKGHRGIARIKNLGSVSLHVVENSACPVLIVH